MNATIETTITLPEILTANTYFWSPGGDARRRRSNEYRHNSAVGQFLAAHAAALEAAGVEVEFEYRESCSNVYKTFRVWKNGKKSNITALKKALGI